LYCPHNLQQSIFVGNRPIFICKKFNFGVEAERTKTSAEEEIRRSFSVWIRLKTNEMVNVVELAAGVVAAGTQQRVDLVETFPRFGRSIF